MDASWYVDEYCVNEYCVNEYCVDAYTEGSCALADLPTQEMGLTGWFGQLVAGRHRQR